jgi:FkbM family methyltransferase
MDGFWESWVTQFIAQNIQPGNICIDAGANFGYYSLLMAELAGQEGKTMAIEPNAYLCKLLSFTNSLNGFHFDIINKALADHAGEITLSIPPNYWGSATIRPNVEEDMTKELVQTDTLDSIIEQAGLPRVDFIKMDCEGVEPMIFAGMEKTLQQNPQLKIIMEYSPFLYNDAQGFTEYLFSHFEVGEVTPIATVRGFTKNDIPYLTNLNDHIDLFLQIKRKYMPAPKDNNEPPMEEKTETTPLNETEENELGVRE